MNFTKIIDDSNNEQTKILFVYINCFFLFALLFWACCGLIRDRQYETIINDIRGIQRSIDKMQLKMKD